jgi:CRISPR system Cascade subunit CasD
MKHLLLRLQAPMMAFGGTTVDSGRPTDRHPAASLLTGLLGNALGYHHRDIDQLQRLQDRMCHGAARLDTPSGRFPATRATDYQTVDLGQDHLVKTGWTTRHAAQERGGGNSSGTHIRQRDYLIDADYLVALRLEPSDEEPTLDALADALDRPSRPLFIGRKCCPPASRIGAGIVDADSLREALLGFSRDGRTAVEMWLPTHDGTVDGSTSWVADGRDWANQIHSGRRLIRHEHLRPGGAQ